MLLDLLGKIAVGIIIGVILFIIEYHTGWFAQRTGRTSIRSLFARWWLRLGPQNKRWLRIHKLVRDILIILSLILGIFIIVYDPLTYGAYFLATVVTVAITLLGFGALQLLSAPMNSVSSALIIFGGMTELFIKWSATRNEIMTPSAVKLLLAAYLTVLVLIWLASYFASEYAKYLHEDVDFLNRASAVAHVIALEEQNLLRDLHTKWPGIRAKVARSRSEAVGAFDWIVPIKFMKFTVVIGCRESWQLKQIKAERHKAPTFGSTITTIVQEAMPDIHLQVVFKVVDATQFREAKKLMALQSTSNDK